MPPAGFAVILGIITGDVSVAGEGVQNQNRIAAGRIQFPVSFVADIYRVQFPVLRQNESDTWYDQNGRIVFTCSKGLTGVGFTRPEWNDIKGMTSGTVERTIMDDTLPGGPIERTITYFAPFDRCDREKDYETVWAEFERRFRDE